MRACLMIMVMISFAPSLWACSCDTMPFTRAIDADEIFVGELFKVEQYTYHYAYYDSFPIMDYSGESTGWKYYFKVKKKWKGIGSDITVVEQSMSSCDFPFDITTSDYLVYAYYGDENWISRIKDRLSVKLSSTYLCTRNSNVHGSGYDGGNWFHSDTAQLNKLFPVPVKLSSYPNFWGRLGASLVLILVCIGLYQLIKRKLATPFTN